MRIVKTSQKNRNSQVAYLPCQMLQGIYYQSQELRQKGIGPEDGQIDHRDEIENPGSLIYK